MRVIELDGEKLNGLKFGFCIEDSEVFDSNSSKHPSVVVCVCSPNSFCTLVGENLRRCSSNTRAMVAGDVASISVFSTEETGERPEMRSNSTIE